MIDYPIRRPMPQRAVTVRSPPYRGGRVHPLTVKNEDLENDKASGIQARVRADQLKNKT